MNDRVIIFDTTLRDGEQAPGAAMNLEEKVKLALLLEAMGVDVIEAGFPMASEGNFLATQAVAKVVRSSIVCGLARATKSDVERCAEAVKGAERHRIHTFIATSPLHMKYKLQLSKEEVLERVKFSVTLARHLVEDVEWSAEDATRTDFDFLCRCIETAIEAGAQTVNLPDTVGFTIPEEYAALITRVKNTVPNIDKTLLSVHCHNDLGLAVANSLAAVQAGARQIHCTMNGLGERAGNTALEEVVMALRTRHDKMPYQTGIDTTHITAVSRTVSTITGFVVQPNKAIIGRNAFAHESGIHQDGMLKNRQTYEIMTPESVGLNKSQLVLGKQSGRAAFKDKLKQLGYNLGDNAIEDAFTRFKILADRKKEVFDEDIALLVDDNALSSNAGTIRFISLELICGNKVKAPTASIELEVDKVLKTTKATGDGPVDAIFTALHELYPHGAQLSLYQVQAVTKGTDAQAEVMVRLEEDGASAQGHGADTDTMVASAKAYVSALNKLVANRHKMLP